MQLKVELKKSVGGYWDGGQKSIFYWTVDGTPQTDKDGQFVRVGSLEANQWFNVALGRTEKGTLGNVRRKLGNTLRKKGVEAKFTYVD